MNPASGPSHAQNFQPGPSSRQQPPRGYTHGAAPGADDIKYHAKYKDLKRKVKELESNNDQLHAKVYQAKRNIQRMKLERAILYERLSSVPNSPDLVERHASHHHTSAPVPQQQHLPHHRGREPREVQYGIPSDNHYRSDSRPVYEPEIPHSSTVPHSSRRGGAGGSSVHDRNLPSLSQMAAPPHAAVVPPLPPRSELASPVEARRSHSARSSRHDPYPESYQPGAPWDEGTRRHREGPPSAMASLASPHMHPSESRGGHHSTHPQQRMGPAGSSYREDAYDRERERDPDAVERSMGYRDPHPSHQYEMSSAREREWDDRERSERERERLSPPPFPQRSERERERPSRDSIPSNPSRIYPSGGNNTAPPPPQIRHSRPASPASASGLDVTGPSRPDSRNGNRPYRLHSTGPPAPPTSQIPVQRGERAADELEYSRDADHRPPYMHSAAPASRPHSQSPVIESRKRLWNEVDEGHGGPGNYADERNHHRRFSGEPRDPPVDDRMELS